MISKLTNAWCANKDKLRDYFKSAKQSEYDSYLKIVKKLFEIVINPNMEYEYFNVKAIKEIDDGDYQGTLLYLIPLDIYHPAPYEYLVTYVYYGSCSGCDTLLRISGYDNGFPTDSQVDGYMVLALHILQHTKWLYDNIHISVEV